MTLHQLITAYRRFEAKSVIVFKVLHVLWDVSILANEAATFFDYRPGSSVGIATDYGLDGPGFESRWGRDFPPVQTGPPSLPYNGYRVFPRGKIRPGRAADHSPPSSAVVM